MKRMIDNKDYEALKNEVNEINTNKLPQYVKAKIDDENHHTFVSNVNNSDNRGASLQYSNVTDENNFINYSVGVDSVLGSFMTIYKKVSGVETSHVLTFDENGDLKIDGNAVGGGKQLYRHNIMLSDTNLRLTLNIINDSNTAFTLSTLATYIADKGFTTGLKLYEASGWALNDGNLYILCGVNNQGTFYATGIDAGTKAGVNFNLANRTLEDIIIAL